MKENSILQELFTKWRSQSDLLKLQYAYAAVVVVTLVAGGLVGLLNQTVAWQILSITWIAAVAFFVNLVSYALVNLFVPTRKPRSTRPAKRR